MMYFTYCKMSPASLVPKQYGRARYRLVTQACPEGFIFHDSEKRLEVTSLLLPLFKLRKLFEGSSVAVAFRINENTIVASYSTAAIPKPVTINTAGKKRYDLTELRLYPQTRDLMGWYIPSVTDQSKPIIAFDIGQMYDGCLQLQRLMGSCPCPHKDSGVCLTENVLPTFNGQVSLADLTTNYYTLFDDNLKARLKREFENVGSFNYVSPGLTTEHDFYEGLRPWDDIDFSKVPERREEFKKRGYGRRLATTHIKASCSVCVFARREITKDNACVVKPCVRLDQCTGSVLSTEAEALIQHVGTRDGIEINSQFTAKQVQALLRLIGTEYSSRVITPTRRTMVELTGFRVKLTGIHSIYYEYTVHSAKGDLDRTTSFSNYQELVTAIPEVAISVAAIENTRAYSQQAIWAYTLQLKARNLSVGWGHGAKLRKATIHESTSDFSIGAQYVLGRATYARRYLNKDNFPHAWVAPYIVGNTGATRYELKELNLVKV